MVCNRCVLVVSDIFHKAGLEPLSVKLGEVELRTAPDEDQLQKLEKELSAVGFEILADQKKKTVEQIKNVISNAMQDLSEKTKNFSTLLSSSLKKEYSYLSKLFSDAEGITIEKYIIDQKTEKVKELLVYGEMTLSEIAYAMGYSSVAHLSSQFKKTTGFTPSLFRKLRDHRRRSIDSL